MYTLPLALPINRPSPLIYLVEEDASQAVELSRALEAHGYQVRTFPTLAAFRLAYSDDARPAAVVMNLTFPEGNTAGAQVIAGIKSRQQDFLPVIFVSERSDLDAYLTAYRAGASRYLTKPVETTQLGNWLDELTGRVPIQPYRVLLIDDDLESLQTQTFILKKAGMEVLALVDPLKMLEVMQTFSPDILLLSIYFSTVTGPELATVLRGQDAYTHLPILFLSDELDMSSQILALNLGGDDFLLKPVQPVHLVAAVTTRAKRARQYGEMMLRLKSTLYEREREHLALNQHALVSIADRGGRITYVNDKFCSTSGYVREELLGKNHRILKSGYHSPEFYKEMWNTVASSYLWQGELCNRRKEGGFYWVESTITPFLDTKGKPYQYVAIRTNITALKRSEQALREAQTIAHLGHWSWNAMSKKLFWSDEIYRILRLDVDPSGFTPSRELLFSFIHPDDVEMVKKSEQTALRPSESHGLDYRLLFQPTDPKSKFLEEKYEIRWVHEEARGDFDVHGNLLRMTGTVQDITDRKVVEERLALFRRIFDVSGQGIRITDYTGRIIYINQAHEQLLGYSQEEVIGKPFFLFVPEEALETMEKIYPTISSGQSWAGLLPMKRKDGSQFTSASNLGALIGTDGHMQYVFNIFTDYTEELARRAELAEAKETAERASQAKSEFLSSMSHELRTPMNAILGFAQFLEIYGRLDEEQKDSISEILKAGHHLLKLINEVLDLAKIEAGRIDLSLEAVGLLPLVEECIDLVQPLAAARNVVLHKENLFGSAVRADRMRLKQALLNLLSNAIKYNAENGSVSISVLDSSGERVRLAVSDTGLGIPPERMYLLFQPFNRLGAENSEVEGTGIGLTITRRLIDRMGGSVGVKSQLGRGSTFWIDLPAEKILEEDSNEEDRLEDYRVDTQKYKYQVLYIEDNPANLRLVSHIFARKDHIQLLTAHTPELGIELAFAHQPDLILLDINLQGIDGYQVLEVFKSDPELKKIPVIAVTANAMPRDVTRGKEAGFVEYLTKPLDVENFTKVVDQWLGR